MEFDQDSPPKEDATNYKQASSSNPKPLAPAGSQLTPSSSLAPGFSLTSRPSSSDSEQDEMLISAKSQSLGETFIDAASMDMGFSRERCIEAVEANLRYQNHFRHFSIENIYSFQVLAYLKTIYPLLINTLINLF